MLQEIIENWGSLSDEDKWVIASILTGGDYSSERMKRRY